MQRFVYDFDEPSGGGRELLGGKGIGLAGLTLLGLPVPAGFTITTDACRDYMRAGDLPEGLEAEVDEHVARLEHRTGKRFGDDADPLLVSVRSGAAVSMPGMMDTILNLGLNDEAAAGLAARTGNPRFAYDSYRRLVQMVFGNKGERSGTGVAFTRNPSTGEQGVYGEFLANAQGEDVVAGIRTPQPLETMRDTIPEAYEQLLDTMRRLEEHYRDMQDIEFTVEDGSLYMLQTRAAKRTAAAALKAAADMVDEGLIAREDAV